VTNGMTHGDVKYILNSYSHCNWRWQIILI
jgi:hypothetical protein